MSSENIVRESAVDPNEAPASRIATVPAAAEDCASRTAGAIVAALAIVRMACWAVVLYLGATHSAEVLAAFPRGIRTTVIYEVMAFPAFAPLALVYGILAIPLLRASRRFRWPTLAVQILYVIGPLVFLRLAFVRADHPSSVHLLAANVVLALLPIGIILLLLFGRPTRRRLRQASVGIALLGLGWTARLTGLL